MDCVRDITQHALRKGRARGDSVRPGGSQYFDFCVEGVEGSGVNVPATVFHQAKVEAQVVLGGETRAQCFPGVEQVPQVGA